MKRGVDDVVVSSGAGCRGLLGFDTKLIGRREVNSSTLECR